ncbi:hypothetical protein BJ742DRAFT_383518 [Cladochytrium replicatum]|nr:hypothetical protein BJ742DRAFT_383518 [Cladochytrium replicatum]
MGRLVLFGRHLDVALDDLYVPSTYGIFFSAIWLTLAIASYCTVHFGPCEWSWHLRTYVLSYMAVLGVDFPTNLVVLLLSMSGTIAKEGPRVWLTPIAHFHMGLTVVTWLVHIYGLWVMNNPREYEPLTTDCPADHTYSLHILIQSALIWALIIHIFWTFFLVLMMMGSKNPITQSFERYYQLWKKRLRWLTCGAYRELNNGKNVMGEVANELAHYFHDVDWAPSDILIGIILLKRDQRRQRYEQSKRRAHMAFRAKQLAEIKKHEEEVKKEAERRKRKSSGGTTAINHFGSSRATPELVDGDCSPPITGNAQIAFRLGIHEDGSASASATPPMPSVLDNCPEPVAESTVLYADLLPKAEDIADVLYFYRYAELAYTQTELKQLAPEMIVHHSSANDLFKSPFFIALDHEAEAVILAIRGTYSAADVLVDLRYSQSAIVIEELREMGCPPLQMVHSGMLETSQVVLTDAAHHLRTLFNDPASRCLNYRLVVCGHSLGAGVAAVTTLLLRQSDFASAICFAYAPPGCLLSPQAAEYFEQFCISVVIGDDMVPRVSRNSMEVMKWDVGRLLSTAQMAKWQVLGSVLGNQCCGAGERQRRKRRKRMMMMRQQLKAQEEENVRLRRQELEAEMEKLKREYATPVSSMERNARRSPNPADETRLDIVEESENAHAEASATNIISRRLSDHTLAAMSANQIRQPPPAASTTLVRSDSIASQAGSIAVAGPSSPKAGSMLRRSSTRQTSKTHKLHKLRLAEQSLAQPERAILADNVGWTMRRSRKLQERRRSSLGDLTNNFGPMTTKDGKPLNKWVARIMALRKTNPSFAGHHLMFGRTEEAEEVKIHTKSLGGAEDDVENRATLPSSQMFLPGRVLYLEKLRRDWDFDENGVEFSLSANAGVPGLVDTAGVGSGFGLALGGSPVFGLYAAGMKDTEGNAARNENLDSNPPTNQPSDTVSPPQAMPQLRVDDKADPSTQPSDFVTESTESQPVQATSPTPVNLTPKNSIARA